MLHCKFLTLNANVMMQQGELKGEKKSNAGEIIKERQVKP